MSEQLTEPYKPIDVREANMRQEITGMDIDELLAAIANELHAIREVLVSLKERVVLHTDLAVHFKEQIQEDTDATDD